MSIEVDRNHVGTRPIEWFGKIKAGLTTAVACVIVVAIVAFLLLPTLMILPMSLSDSSFLEFPPNGLTFRWYVAYLSDADWMAATWFSLKVAVLSSLLATLLGTAGSLAIIKGNLPFKSGIEALALGPVIIPHIVFGVALYLVLGPMHLNGSILGFVAGHTVLSIPFVVITVSAALKRLDPSLELAALSCGASRLEAFIHITMPGIRAGLLSGFIFAFLASFDEATVAFFISDTGGKSIGRKMFEDVDFNLTPVIAAASSLVMISSLVLIGLVHLFTSRDTARPAQEGKS